MSLSSGLLPSNKVLKIRLVINLITLMQSMSSKSLSLIVVVVKFITFSMSTRGLKHWRSLSTRVADVDTNCPTGLAPQVK